MFSWGINGCYNKSTQDLHAWPLFVPSIAEVILWKRLQSWYTVHWRSTFLSSLRFVIKCKFKESYMLHRYFWCFRLWCGLPINHNIFWPVWLLWINLAIQYIVVALIVIAFTFLKKERWVIIELHIETVL
jgi:hypothetical protein